MNDKIVNKIGEILKKNAKKDPTNRGLSITELVKISKLKRCAVRTIRIIVISSFSFNFIFF